MSAMAETAIGDIVRQARVTLTHESPGVGGELVSWW